MYPEAWITKGEVLEFYRRMASWLLPYLRDRPATLERLPDGLHGSDAPHFWQKHTPDYSPDWIKRIELPSERGDAVQYVLVNDEATLLYLVNQGTLTFLVGFSRIADLTGDPMDAHGLDGLWQGHIRQDGGESTGQPQPASSAAHQCALSRLPPWRSGRPAR
jgi:DNA primase